MNYNINDEVIMIKYGDGCCSDSCINSIGIIRDIRHNTYFINFKTGYCKDCQSKNQSQNSNIVCAFHKITLDKCFTLIVKYNRNKANK